MIGLAPKFELIQTFDDGDATDKSPYEFLANPPSGKKKIGMQGNEGILGPVFVGGNPMELAQRSSQNYTLEIVPKSKGKMSKLMQTQSGNYTEEIQKKKKD